MLALQINVSYYAQNYASIMCHGLFTISYNEEIDKEKLMSNDKIIIACIESDFQNIICWNYKAHWEMHM